MGCDIHVVIEKRWDNKWVGVKELSGTMHFPFDEKAGRVSERPTYIPSRGRERNYDLFARLAGVWGEGPEPKGMPEDASDLARMLYPEDDSDLHSHSWCTLREYVEALTASTQSPAQVFLLENHPAIKQPYMYWFGMYEPDEGEEYRVVFCFDN